MSEVPADARNPEPKPQPASATPRFVLSCFGGEGVFLDLARGNFFRVNRAAALVCQGIIDGRAEDAIAAQLAEAFAIPHARALSDVRTVIGQIAAERPARRVNPISFAAEPQGYRMDWEGT